MDDPLALFLAVLIVGVVVLLISWGVMYGQYKQAKAAYEEALAACRREPADVQLQEKARALGRAYAQAGVKMRNVGWKDAVVLEELAISNDIAAATGRAGTGPEIRSSERA